MMAGRVLTAEQLGALADRLGVRADWHEPDEQRVTAVVRGTDFGNDGFWGHGPDGVLDSYGNGRQELWVELLQDGEPVAEVNLASLLAWASAPHRARGRTMSKHPASSRFYDTDPSDPEAPRRIGEYDGPHHGLIREGDLVVYENPAWQRRDGSYATGGMDGTYTVTEIISVLGADHPPQAILDDGDWEVSAASLRTVSRRDGGDNDG